MHSFYPENEGTLNTSAYQTRRLRLQICAAVMVKIFGFGILTALDETEMPLAKAKTFWQWIPLS